MAKGSLLAVFVLAIMICGLVGSVNLAYSQQSTVPKPSVPEFTISYIDLSYDVPATATSSIDPYTGNKTIITHDGYRVNRQNITVTVKNQPFTAHIGNTTYHLCYNIIRKGHFEEGNWQYFAEPKDFLTTLYYPEQSTDEYTVITFQGSYLPNSQIDIQVIAVIFHEGQGMVYEHIGVGERVDGFVFDITSDWSKIQTLNLADNSVTTSTDPTSLPTISPTEIPSVSNPSPTASLEAKTMSPLSTELIIAVVAIAVAVAVVVGFLLGKRAGRKT